MSNLPAGLFASLLGGGPIPLPSISCALCLAISGDETAIAAERDTDATAGGFISPGKTIAGGWLVCEFHAEVMAHQLAETNYSTNGGPDPYSHDGRRRPLADCFALPTIALR